MLIDKFGRNHNYLRISLTEKCNLRCSYCMPEHGIPLLPRKHLMQQDEIYEIASVFVQHGVNKIRFTGGEPLIRKDFSEILEKIHHLPVKLSITTNGVIVDRFMEDFNRFNLRKVNVSLDSLHPEKFEQITRRNQFHKTFGNIVSLVENGFHVKVNCVLMKQVNDDEIVDFVELTKELPISMRFIEFMPFDGNRWDRSKLVTQQEIFNQVINHYGEARVTHLPTEKNFTARNYQVKGFRGNFGIISSVSNPFCDSCNRIRLTADGKIKNCLFSNDETNLLEAYRSGENIEQLIIDTISRKKAVRAGMNHFDQISNRALHSRNRSMIAIGG